jgi:hypothetical protein
VKAGVFDILAEYVAASLREADDEMAITAAIAFCENFFAQFFPGAAGVEIQTISLRTKFIAVQVRRKLKAANEAKETILLITWFEKLCDIYPDVVSMGYGATSPAGNEQLQKYMATLLRRIAAWATAKGLELIAVRAKEAIAEMNAAGIGPA